MLHVTSEVGKVGRREREKRHFPGLSNRESQAFYMFRSGGRRYIPHNYGTDAEWKPHNCSVNVEYTDVGPDWSSCRRYIKPPSSPSYPAMEIWPNNWRSMKPFPYTYARSRNEWLLDPDLTRLGLRCWWNGVHPASQTSIPQITTCPRKTESATDKRNGLGEASPGDKSYQAAEYEAGFFKTGSARPGATLFSTAATLRKSDTFIPLVPLPPRPKETYTEKEKRRQLEMEIQAVKDLDNWKPATPLFPINCTSQS